MKLFGALLCALLVLSGHGVAFAQNEESSTPLATDRPGNGNAAVTVPRSRLHIESGVGYARETRAAGNQHLVSFPTSIRFGILDSFELRASFGPIGIEHTSIGTPLLHVVDTSVGTKVQALHNRGWTPNVAVVVDVYLPSGSGPFGGNAVVPDARGAMSWALPRGFGLLLNLGADVPPSTVGRVSRFIHVANLSYAPPLLGGHLSLFVESYGRSSIAHPRWSLHQLDVGAAIVWRSDWQIDVFTQHGLTEAAPDFQVAVGFSTRI